MKKITEQQVISSAVWAAYGDALGFSTELISQAEFSKRFGMSGITGLIDWKKKVGGMFGPEVDFPVGTYSDDTQLRLSTSRAIRGDGFFDVESFAKIELPVWLNYALGAGRGSKAAASNLSLREVTWSQNFFESNGVSYCEGGGNGAAMRIQPHVWQVAATGEETYIRDVVRNTLCTHGHPRGIIGAAIHAAMVYSALRDRKPLSPDSWAQIGESAAVQAYEALVDDMELSLVWVPNWNNRTKKGIEEEWASTVLEWHHCVSVAKSLCERESDPLKTYIGVLQELGGFAPESRGSGLRTSLFAAVLVWLYRDHLPDEALLAAANAFQSDTDTIATMAGAIIGSYAEHLPSVHVQDFEYIRNEARRIYRIGLGQRQASFRYPDLLKWVPPKNQSDAWSVIQGKPRLNGIGELLLLGTPYAPTRGRELLWQWCELPFGQTVLAKRRRSADELLPDKFDRLPDEVGDLSRSLKSQSLVSKNIDAQKSFSESTLDHLTDLCIRSGFSSEVVGECLLSISDGENGIERAIAFAAIVAKAKLARRR